MTGVQTCALPIYNQDIENAIYAGIRLAVEQFATTHGKHPDYEQEFEDGYTQKFREFMKAELDKDFDRYISSQLKLVVKNTLKLEVSNITFQPFKDENTGGHVEQNNLVVLNILSIKRLAARFIDNIIDMVFNSYGPGEYVNALYSILDEIGRAHV